MPVHSEVATVLLGLPLLKHFLPHYLRMLSGLAVEELSEEMDLVVEILKLEVKLAQPLW